MVRRDSRMASTASIRSLFISTTSADEIATSVPAPIAMPTSARASAGASLMPSPIMATLRPLPCFSRTIRSLSCGSTSAITSVTPSSDAMDWAVFLLSPVSSVTSMCILRSASTAALLVGLSTSATAKIPTIWRFAAKNSGVLPAAANSSPSFCIEPDSARPLASSMRRLPAKHGTPSTDARMPCPSSISKSVTERSCAFFSRA